MDIDEESKRKEREYNRKVIAEWKKEAKMIQAADPSTRMLLRESKRVAMLRIEEAARSEEDFKKLNRLWDKREIVERNRVHKQELVAFDDMEDYELPDSDLIIPTPFSHVWWRELLGGDFISYIYDCPHEIQELTSSRPVYDFTKLLSDEQKEILYYRAIRQWSPQRIAAFRNQTDRNIRKVYNNMIADIRLEMFNRLYKRYVRKLPLTFEQKRFCEDYFIGLDETQKSHVKRYLRIESNKKKNETGADDE